MDSYTRAEILSPADNAAVRSNAGTLTVLVRIDPQIQDGHRIQLLLDGVPSATAGRQHEFHLENIDRGTRTLQLQIIDNSGHVLFTGPQSTFHLLRHSRLHP
ncbi:MAG: hypothetical protein OXP09_00490 [Gammaproteobacteria bacterium]|nr:hypothetical protein [Gammaproteobacteria bacterium]